MISEQDHSTNRPLLAFCHIEKAAGTSLTHILRRIFFLRYAAVRPMHSVNSHFFTAHDLKTTLLLNPFLRGIGGHSVVPHGDLISSQFDLKFITQLRDPIARATSQFRFWVNRLNLKETWQSYLKHPASKNFQVKKIAGSEDLDLAKETLTRHFLLAGTVDQFDEFLVLLASELDLSLHLFTYSRQNVASRTADDSLPNSFFDELTLRNELDQSLFDWVRTEFIAERIKHYSGDFYCDLEKFRSMPQEDSLWREAIDSVYRNVYIKPVSGLVRMANGLPFVGSYSKA